MPVAQVGLARALSTLWDSRRQLPVSGTARAGIFPRVYLKLWDSQPHAAKATLPVVENELKFLKSVCRGLLSSFGKPEDQPRILPLMGCQWRVFQVRKCEPLILLDEMNVGSVSRLNRPGVPSKAEREPSLVFAGSLCVFRYLPETNSSQRNQRSTLSEGYPFKINELQQNTQHPLLGRGARRVAAQVAGTLIRRGSLVAVNCDCGFGIDTKDAGGVVIHVRDLGDSPVSCCGFDAGIARGNTDDAL